MEPRGAKSAVHADDSADSNGSHNNREKAKKTPVFVTCYEDWEAFDAAVAHAMTQHHPLRKRSSLTFEVYNRTVSKGRHDRRVIAEFLSKTYKCTHGIKFRARGHGKRLRHKLRDIGCPFHVYASAVEFGETYRVKVRVHDEHNHPIGPNTMTSVEALHRDTEYEFVAPAAEAPLAAPLIGPASLVHSVALPGQQPVQHAQDLLQAQAQALVHAHMQSRMPTRSASTMTEQFLSIPGSHCTEALLEQNTATIGSSSASSSSRPLSSRKRKASLQFEDSATTFEGLRQQLSAFAQERGWDQFYSPRNLLLALTRKTSELCECFQWRNEGAPAQEWTAEEKEHLGEELGEMVMYLIQLADECQVDLPVAITAKMSKNTRKYPVRQQMKAPAAMQSNSNESKRSRLEDTAEDCSQ